MHVFSSDGSAVYARNPAGPANITAVGLPGTTTSIDGDGDGWWDVEVALSSWQGFRAIDEIAIMQQKDMVETRMDEDDDGTFETIHAEFRVGSSKEIPVWDAITWNGTAFMNYEAWDFNKTDWRYGYVDSEDTDGDGIMDRSSRCKLSRDSKPSILVMWLKSIFRSTRALSRRHLRRRRGHGRPWNAISRKESGCWYMYRVPCIYRFCPR